MPASSERWYETLEKMNAYVKSDVRVPSTGDKNPQKRAVGQWVSDQRAASDKGTLPPERIVKLKSILGWSWAPLDDAWKKARAAVAEFRAGGGGSPSHMSKDPEERRMGQWESAQRTYYKNHKLSADRIDALKSIPGWRWIKH